MRAPRSFSLIFGLALVGLAANAQACTRVVYHGEDGLNITGRTMDWRDPMNTRLWLFPAGLKENGGAGDNSAAWTSRYGSVVVTSLNAAVSDGMNQKGLVANMLWLNASKYPDQCAANEKRLAISAWAQYFLDNFATVQEAIASLKTHPVCLISAPIPGTDRFTTLHLSLSDASGNSAILEYIHGKLVIHEGRQYQVMTNDPEYPQQMAVAKYWEQIGGTRFLPGTNQAPDRFARAEFYIHAIPKTASNRTGVAQVLSVLNNVSVPMGISTPGHPNISTTRWRVVADQRNLHYYYNSTSSMDLFWVNLNKADLKPGAPVRTLPMGAGQTYSGDVVDKFVPTKPFHFVPVPPEVLAAYR
ncbi:linear amide C-N hydrolase [Acidithiobacillus sp. AMEEHan]|uniref:linear amide C-N hydrolase n=1 Tax=Acidithiobacillus sp. AMEEHan TaxID=2994951 RepID=UPI0027E3B466|nr:linear amide C-N hydrolase [Acidithiobacillus sp. AMEEHan]